MKFRWIKRFGYLSQVMSMMIILWPVDVVQAQVVGKVYDKSNYQEIKHLLIPAMEEMVKKGEWTYRIGKFDFPLKHWDKFEYGSKMNEGKYGLDERGHLIDPKTGKFPEYNVYGIPFPEIDPKDPNIATKLMWNFNFQRYRFMGSVCNGTETSLVDTGGEHFVQRGLASMMYWKGRMEGKGINNPRKYLLSNMLVNLSPMTMKGVAMLSHEFIEADKSSVMFSYVPAVRRVRQLTGTARSDSLFGTDGCIDDEFMFSGKTATFKWRFLGERMVLAPFSHTRKSTAQEETDGTIHRNLLKGKFGFNTSGWTGASWACTSGVFVPRAVWIIEGEPLDPYYNYGKTIYYLDKETYHIPLKEVFDKNGSAWHTNLFFSHYTEAPSGNNTIGDLDFMLIIDHKISHATIQQYTPASGGGDVFMPASRLGPGFFTVQNMLKKTK